MHSFLKRCGAVVVASFFACVGCVSADSAQPTVAVLGFSSAGITNWWGSGFDPGEALSDIMTDRLVNSGKYSVVDRSHLNAILKEQNTSASGDVTPATEAKLGRMVGAGYLIVGKIIEFDKTGGQKGGLGSLVGGLGGVSSTKTVMRVSVEVLEVNSGRIVEALDDEQSTTSTSFAIGGGAAGTGAVYTSQDFQNSAPGKVITSVADDLVAKMDPSKLVATAPAPTISGAVLDIDSGSIILNIGANKGVQTGMMFDTFEVKELRDPDSGKMIRSEIPRGTIQIVSVSQDSSVAKRISGTIHARQSVHSEP